MPSDVSILKCDCGQRCWIPAYRFNRPGALKYGTPYRCPKCHEPLGDSNFVVVGAMDAE